MERYAAFIVRHRIAVVTLVLLITALLATQLRHLHLEISRHAVMPQDHPYVQIQNRISELFGGEAVVAIGVVAKHGDIFTPAILSKIRRITQGLLDTPGVVEHSVFSIAAPYVHTVVPSSDDAVEIRPLMEVVPETDAAIDELRGVIERDVLLRRTLVSTDHRAAAILAEFDDRLSDKAIGDRISAIVAPERDSAVTIALAGAPILRAALEQYTRLVAVLFPLAVVVIALVHYEAFRTVQAMLLPLMTALLSVAWALGIMGVLGLAMDTWSAVTPVVILAVAAGHAVQILKRYYEEYGVLGDNKRAVTRSIAAVGPVMLTAGVIASAGFASLVTFGISSVRVFGLLLACGILSALVIEMTFTPACRSLLRSPKRRELQREQAANWLDRLLEWHAALLTRQPRLVLEVVMLVLAIAVLGALRIRVDNSFRLWFSPSTAVRLDDALLNETLPGTASLRILIEGTEQNIMREPAVLRAMSDLQAFMEREPKVGAVVSIADHVKRLNWAMNHGDEAHYVIPSSKRVIGEYLFLYSMAAGPEALSAFVDGAYQHAVIRALSKTDTAYFSRQYLNRLQDYAALRFRNLPVSVRIAGGTLGVQTAMNDVIVREKIFNVAQVSAIILILSIVVLRSLVGGLFVVLPLLVAVGVNLGIMGWSGTWLDMTTAAITAMGISIGADFAIYLIFRMREEARSAELPAAVRTSLLTSGKAIFFVSSAVILGYLVLPLAGFSVWNRLGVLTATIIAASAVATLVVIPSMVLIARPKFLLPVERPAREVEIAAKAVAGQTVA